MRTPGARPAAALAAALAALCALAAFAGGATGVPDASWAEALAALVALGALLVRTTAPIARRRRTVATDEALVAPPSARIAIALLVALAGWALVSLAWSSAPDRSWDVANREVAYALVLAAAVAAGVTAPGARRWVAAGVGLAGVAVAGWALLGVVAPGALFGHPVRGGRLAGELETFLDLGLLCALMAPVALRLATDDTRAPWATAAALAGALVLVVALGLTYSRAGVLVLVAGLAVSLAAGPARGRLLAATLLVLGAAAIPLGVAYSSGDDALGLPLAGALVLVVLAALLVLGRARRRLETRAGGLAALAVALVALAAGVAVVAGSDGGLGRLDDPAPSPAARTAGPERLRATDNGGRRILWDEALGAASDKAVSGWGAGAWPVVHGLYRSSAIPARDARSTVLQTLAERGAVGLALLALALAALAVAVARSPWPGAALGALAGLVVASVVASAWEVPALVLPVLAVAGATARRPVAVAADDPVLPDEDPAAPGPRWGALTAGAIVLALVATSALLPAWSHDRAQAAFRIAGDPRATENDLQGAAADARLASKLDPPAIAPNVAAAAVAERRGRVLEARGELLTAVDEQPDSAAAWAQLARLALRLADRPGALAAARRALSLDPHDPALFALAEQAEAALAPPNASPTATGTPLPSFVIK